MSKQDGQENVVVIFIFHINNNSTILANERRQGFSWQEWGSEKSRGTGNCSEFNGQSCHGTLGGACSTASGRCTAASPLGLCGALCCSTPHHPARCMPGSPHLHPGSGVWDSGLTSGCAGRDTLCRLPSGAWWSAGTSRRQVPNAADTLLAQDVR